MFVIYAFPLSYFGFNASTFYSLKILKCMLAISLMLIITQKEFRHINIFHLGYSKSFVDYAPTTIMLFIYILFNLNKFRDVNSNYSLVSFTALATFLAALTEEIIFRGYFQNLFIKRTMPVIKSIILSSLIFSIAHTTNILRYGGDAWGVLNQIIFAFFWGLLMGSLYVLHKNILFVTLCHFVFNLPASLRYLKEYYLESDNLIRNLPSSFFENITASLLWVAICSPILFLSLFYLRKIKAGLNH